MQGGDVQTVLAIIGMILAVIAIIIGAIALSKVKKIEGGNTNKKSGEN